MKDSRINIKVSRQSKELLEAMKSELGFKNQQEVIEYLLICFSEVVQNELTYVKHIEYVEKAKLNAKAGE